MKKLALTLLCILSITGCATSQSSNFTSAGIAVTGRNVGTQGSTRARTFDGVAMNAHNDDGDNTGRDPRGIPTPQPVRDPAASAHAIPVPQPPIPTPDHHGSSVGHNAARWAN